MELKKEVQQTIVKQPPLNNGKVTQEEFSNILRLIAPGTNLRAALNGSLKTGKGALIAIENDYLTKLIDGGFRINARFTPQRLIELTKMDGAIILSKDMKKINYANVLLTPDTYIATVETGTRHKAAERTAKQTGTLVIAISERKNEITLYYKNLRYPIIGTDELLRKTNEHIQILEKQRESFDQAIEKLTRLELKNQLSFNQAIHAIQRGTIIQKVSNDVQKYIMELGREGIILKTRLKEITHGVEKETDLIIKDYTNVDLKKTRTILNTLSYDQILDSDSILKALAYDMSQQPNQIKGWRILSKTSLSDAEIAALVKSTGTLGKAIHSNNTFHQTILGAGKASIFHEEISKIKMNN